MEDIESLKDAVNLIDAYKRQLQELEMQIMQVKTELQGLEGALSHERDHVDEWKKKADHYKVLWHKACDTGGLTRL